MTQVEGDTFLRGGALVALGLILWVLERGVARLGAARGRTA